MNISEILVSLVLLSRATAANAQIMTVDKVDQGASLPSLSLELSASSLHVKMDVEIKVLVSLKNIAGKELLVGDEVAGGEMDYDLSAYDESGVAPPTTAYWRYTKNNQLPGDPKFAATHSRNTAILEPGKSLVAAINVGKLSDRAPGNL